MADLTGPQREQYLSLYEKWEKAKEAMAAAEIIGEEKSVVERYRKEAERLRKLLTEFTAKPYGKEPK